MIIYMLKSEHGYYQRGHGWNGEWVEQEKGSIWSTKFGPASTIGSVNGVRRRRKQEPLEMVVEEFVMLPKAEYERLKLAASYANYD